MKKPSGFQRAAVFDKSAGIVAYYTDDSLFPENMEKLIDATFHELGIASDAHPLAV